MADHLPNRSLPAELEFLVTDEKAFIEIEGFIRFLRSDDIPPEYLSEAKHLKNIAAYIESQMAEILSQRRLLAENFDPDRPN